MKILFIISSLRSGGAERVISTLANVLSANHEVTIVKLDNEKPFYKVNENVALKSLDLYKSSNAILAKVLHNFKILFEIREAIKKSNPDIVIPFISNTNIYTIIATRFLNKKILISERTNYSAMKNKFWKFLRYITYPFSNGMVVLSQYDYDKYSNVKNKKIIFNPLFIDSSPTEVVKKEKIIVAVGSLFEGKAFDVLLHSLDKIDREVLNDWKVLIIGDGEKKEELEELIGQLNLGSIVKLLGKKTNIEDYYKKASVFVSTSREEGFPNALSEALSFGCASVATDCITGPSELIENEKNGFLVPVDDIEKIAMKLEELIKDEDLRKEFSNKSVEFSQKYKSEIIIKEWEEYIEKIVKEEV